MIRKLRLAMFVGVLAACTASPLFGQEPAGGGEPVGPPAGAQPPVAAPANCGPAMITIPVVECVPETYKVKQITYKKVCKQETYTAMRCETFPVTKTRQVCTYVKKAVYKDVCKTVTEKVPVWETKTVMKPCYSYQNVTEMVSKKVDKGYWAHEEVPAHFKNFCNKLGSFGHKNDCCDPCANSCNSCPAPATRCVKKWHACWVTECCPVTVCKKVCTMKPECVKVCTYQCVTKQVTCKVCEYVCEPCYKTETYCCYETRQVPVTCTRNVVSCVPCEEWVTCTKLVAKTTYRQVPACNTSCNSCCETSNSCCESGFGHKLRGLFANRGHGNKGGCCTTSSCGNGGCH